MLTRGRPPDTLFVAIKGAKYKFAAGERDMGAAPSVARRVTASRACTYEEFVLECERKLCCEPRVLPKGQHIMSLSVDGMRLSVSKFVVPPTGTLVTAHLPDDADGACTLV